MIYKKIHYYRQLKNVRHSKTYLLFIVSNQENILLTTEKNWRERKKLPRWTILCGFFCLFIFVFCFKSYSTKLPSKVLTLTSHVSFLFTANSTGQTAFIPRSKIFFVFCLLKLLKVWKKKLAVSQSIFLQIVYRKHKIYKIRFRLRFLFPFI